MDPDLMMSFAEMGCSQLPPPPRWNTSTTAVYEFEDPPTLEDDGQGDGVMGLSRAASTRRLLDPSLDGEGEDDDAELSPSQRASPQLQDQPRMKRRWSTRLGEALADFGKVVKKRTDSWGSKRKDSVAPLVPAAATEAAPELLVGERADGGEISASPLMGSGNRSRDGDDEMSSEDELLRFTTTTTTTTNGRRMSSQPGAGGRTRSEGQVHYAYPAEQLRRAATEGEQDVHSLVWRLQREEETRRLHRNPAEHLAMMERGLRIAEREGAFTDAAFEKKFKKAHRRLRRTDSEQSQASIKLKAKVARKKSESDIKFRRWSETKDLSPLSRVLKRLWPRPPRNGTEMGSAVEELGERSEMPGSEGDVDENARSRGSVASIESLDSTDEWREGNVEAMRFAGWALQGAPIPF